MKKGFILTPFVISLALIVTGWFIYENNKQPLTESLTLGAADPISYTKTLLPTFDSVSELGTSTRAYLRLTTDEICLAGDCQTTWSAGGGEANTGASLGTGLNIFDSKVGTALRFNSIAAGSNITLSTSTNSNTIVISSTGGSGGSGTFSTTTSTVAGQLINYPNNTTDIVTVGSNATTSSEVYFDPNAQRYQIGNASTASTTVIGNATTTGGFAASFLRGFSNATSTLTGSLLVGGTNGLMVNAGALTGSNLFLSYNSTSNDFPADYIKLESIYRANNNGDFNLSHVASNGTTNQGLFWDTSTGNFGFATTNPTEMLHVSRPASDNDYTLIRMDSGVVQSFFGASTPDLSTYIGSRSNHPLALVTNNSSRLQIEADGTINVASNDFNFNKGGSDATSNWNISQSVDDFLIFQRSGGTSDEHTLMVIDAPASNPDEATLTTRLNYGGGNQSFTDWYTENYTSDRTSGIAIAKRGTGEIFPFALRFWDASAGNLSTQGKWAISANPSTAVGIGASTSTLEASGAAFLVSSTTARTQLQNASSTIFSANIICLTADSCITTWPTGGSGLSSYDAWTHPSSGKSATTSEIQISGGLLSTASTTISGDLRLSSLGQGFLFAGSNGLVQPTASSSIRLSWFNNDAGFLTSLAGAASSTLLSDTNSWSGNNTFTNATSTNFGITNVYAIGSGGIDFHSNNGTPIADFGGGGGAGASFFGGVNIDGTTRLATSLTGILKATSGTVSTATAGTDYENPLTFTFPLSRSSNIISFNGLSTSSTWTGSGVTYRISDNSIGTTATTSASCTGTVSCSSFTVIGNSPITITGSGASGASTTLLADTNSWSGTNRFSNASSTLFSSDYASSTLGLFGNVGIGTTGAPSGGKLQIIQSVDTNAGGLTISNVGASASNRIWMDSTGNARFDAGGTAGGLMLFNGAGTGNAAIGTTTSQIGKFTSFSSTAPQLSLSAGAGLAQWVFRNAGGNLYLSTTTVAGTATTTTSALSILNTGEVIVRNLFQIFNVLGTKVMDVAGNAVTLLGAWDFGGADSLEIPNGTNPTTDATGEIAWDTTSGNLEIATSTGHVVIGSATTTIFGSVGTTTGIVSGLVQEIPPHPLQQVVTSVWCKVTSGTSLQVYLSDGTNNTNTITCTTTGTQYAITTNNTWTSYETMQLVYGTKTGNTGDIVLRAMGYRISD